jgi:hypothetical protein
MRAWRVSREQGFSSRLSKKSRLDHRNAGFDADFSAGSPATALKRVFRYIFPLAHADLLRTLPRMRYALA